MSHLAPRYNVIDVKEVCGCHNAVWICVLPFCLKYIGNITTKPAPKVRGVLQNLSWTMTYNLFLDSTLATSIEKAQEWGALLHCKPLYSV